MPLMRCATGRERRKAFESALSGSVGVEVLDHGHGYPRELADEMFQPLVTTKPGGLGVGLAVSRRIVRAHVMEKMGARSVAMLVSAVQTVSSNDPSVV